MKRFNHQEYTITCPCCGVETSMLLNDTEHQHYYEDCDTCESPIEVDFKLNKDGVVMRVEILETV
ncbi:MAG: CPXCG motif-containing cysteine-rich protein [Cyclobacteriaceae bacterium]